MIELKEQNELFELIASRLKKDIECFALGGTAMMYYGYKSATKDIDLLFMNKEDRDEFIRAITILGYKQRSIKGIYNRETEDKPIIFTRGDERFDIFLGNIIGISIPTKMTKEYYARLDFVKKSTLTLNVMKKEDIFIMKSATNRERDFDDMLTIAKKDELNWEYIIDIILEIRKRGNSWMVHDLEEKMQELKKSVRIEKKWFDMIYKKFE